VEIALSQDVPGDSGHFVVSAQHGAYYAGIELIPA